MAWIMSCLFAIWSWPPAYLDIDQIREHLSHHDGPMSYDESGDKIYHVVGVEEHKHHPLIDHVEQGNITH